MPPLSSPPLKHFQIALHPRRAFLKSLGLGAAGVLASGWREEACAAGNGTTSSLKIDQLAGSEFWPEPLRALIGYALNLTPRQLGYQFGSSDPDNGGMDCSGTMYHVLQHQGISSVPRQSNEIWDWVEESGRLTRVTGTPALTDSLLAGMRPGDLLFWTGTYDTSLRKSPISHVMMYLGKTTEGAPVVFGASDGRSYRGQRRNGVSVFDFRIPRAEGKARFVGYGPVPGFDIHDVPAQPPAPAKEAEESPVPKKPSERKKTAVHPGKKQISKK